MIVPYIVKGCCSASNDRHENLHQYECLNADVGSNGRVNDSRMWSKCLLLQAIDDGSVKLPEDDYLINHCKLPHIFLGDDAFALKEFMIKKINS